MYDPLAPVMASGRLAAGGRLVPGLALSLAVAVAAVSLEPLVQHIFPLPPMVVALVIGIALHAVAARPTFEPGTTWCVKKLLRVAIALLGVRIALADIANLGLGTGLLVLGSMALTIISGFLLARLLDVSAGYGALAGAATAVCGASATLATSSVIPHYPQKGADVAFTVVAANGVSTLVMVAYPAFCAIAGFDPHTTGVLLGATIHDMAQVVGAGYAVSEPVGNTAVIVKLFRVFLLLPVVLSIGWWFSQKGASHGAAKVPVPVFALVFLGLTVVNSLMLNVPTLAPIYAPIRSMLVTASTWGLLVAIAALGLGTSLAAVLRIGWRHMIVFAGTTAIIFFAVTAGVFLLA